MVLSKIDIKKSQEKKLHTFVSKFVGSCPQFKITDKQNHFDINSERLLSNEYFALMMICKRFELVSKCKHKNKFLLEKLILWLHDSSYPDKLQTHRQCH